MFLDILTLLISGYLTIYLVKMNSLFSLILVMPFTIFLCVIHFFLELNPL